MESSSNSESSSDSENYWKCDIDDKVKSMKFQGENKLIIRFVDTNQSVILLARAECCSTSWFQCPDRKVIIGKKIKYIYDSNKRVDLPKSKKNTHDKNTHDKNHVIIIRFDDDSEYQFYMRNSSNGYYDAHLDINVY